MAQPTPAIMQPAAGTWELEPAHTTVGFVGRHLGGLSKIRGRFTDYRTNIQIAENLEDSSAEVWIETASVDTGVGKRDDHLRSPDFLDIEKYPQMHFVSRSIRQLDEDRWAIDGDLTIRDVTRPLTLEIEVTGVIDDPMYQSKRAGASATAEINREDYGMVWNMPLGITGLVGKHVRIEIEAEALLTPYIDPAATTDTSE